jgi:hypothetical protein
MNGWPIFLAVKNVLIKGSALQENYTAGQSAT